MDFGFDPNGGGTNTNVTPQEPQTGGTQETQVNNPPATEPVTDLNNPPAPPANEPPANEPPANENELTEGSIIEIDDNEYTVDANGNLVDKDNKIFKQAAEVKDFLASLDSEDGNPSEINYENISKLLGVEVVDQNGRPMDFSSSENPVEDYIMAATEQIQQQAAENAITNFFERYPAMQDVLNYYIANGYSLEGLNAQVDSMSNIEIEESNVEQQENIIRMIWNRQGRKGDSGGYIEYLKANGNLYEVAKQELEAIKEQEENDRKEQAARAQQIEEQRRNEEIQYWRGIKGIIDKQEIAGYKIPNSIIVTRDGKKVSRTPADFFNYLYLVDDKGHSQYENDVSMWQ